jgi:phage terminase large subunit
LLARAARTELPDYAECLWTPARHYALYGGRGGGKSWAVADHLLIEAARNTLRVGCAREIQDTIRDSVKRLLDDRIEALGLGGYFDSTEKEIRGKRNDSLFVFKGLWRNPDGMKSMEGMDRVWIEEAARVSQRTIDILIPTVRKEGYALIWTWNPEYEHDPVDKMFRGPAGPPPNSIVRRVLWEDNPWFPHVLREAMEHMFASEPDRAEHIYGGEYVKAIEGAYYAKQLRLAREQGRMTALALDPNLQVKTYWDLGRTDATAIVVAQIVGERIQVVDYCEGVGQPPSYYMHWLRANGYEGCLCVLPHDGAAIHPDNPLSMSYEMQLKRADFQTRVVRNQGPGAAIQRVDAARRLFNRIWFHEDATRPLIRALGQYHEKRDEQRNVGLGPEHDWASHGADAFGLMCIAYEPPRTHIEPRLSPRVGTIA